MIVNKKKELKCQAKKKQRKTDKKMTSSGLINYLKSSIFGKSTDTPIKKMASNLETDAGAFLNGNPVNEETLLLRITQNQTAIKNIGEQDLDDMEKDLAFYEKV